MKRQLTPEQRAKTEAKRARFAEIVKRVAGMTDEQRAEIAGEEQVTTCEGHTLSLHNQVIIAMQIDRATIVGGYRQWQAQQRQVKRGESGLMIWIPKNERKGQPAGDTGEGGEAAGRSDKGDEGSSQSPTFFMGTVFDISQTEAAQ